MCGGRTPSSAARVDRVARALVAIGLRPGDRLGIWAPNCAEWVLIQYASAKAGVILVNINPAYRTSELEYVLNQSGLPRSDLRPCVQELGLCGDGQ